MRTIFAMLTLFTGLIAPTLAQDFNHCSATLTIQEMFDDCKCDLDEILKIYMRSCPEKDPRVTTFYHRKPVVPSPPRALPTGTPGINKHPGQPNWEGKSLYSPLSKEQSAGTVLKIGTSKEDMKIDWTKGIQVDDK